MQTAANTARRSRSYAAKLGSFNLSNDDEWHNNTAERSQPGSGFTLKMSEIETLI